MKSERAKPLSTLKSPTVLKAVTIAVLSMVLFSTTHVSVRFLADTMSTFEIVFWRMLLSMAMFSDSVGE